MFGRGGAPLAEGLPDLGVVGMFTWVHGLVFLAIGGVVAWLLAYVERHPRAGFGILMLFVFFEFGFVAAAMVFADPVLHALAGPAALVPNLLPAGRPGGYLWGPPPKPRAQP